MSSGALGWIGETTLAGLFQPALHAAGLGSPIIVHGLALTLAFLAITFLHVVLGELVPKQVALGRAERLSLILAWPMTFFLKAARIPLAVLHASSFYLAQVFGARPAHAPGQPYTAEELKMLVTVSSRSADLPTYQQEMIHNVIDLGPALVREVMVPRVNMVSIPVELSLETLVRVVTEDQHSRLPVYQDTPEQIIGVLYTKDLFRVWQ